MERSRCAWASGTELMRQYHDTEWGVPVHDDLHAGDRHVNDHPVTCFRNGEL